MGASIPKGVIPPMTTPFRQDGEIALGLVSRQVEWLIEAGVHGVAAGGSTGEGHTLDPSEFGNLIAATVEAACGRVPVIAGIIVDSTRDAIRRGHQVRDFGIAALQVTPVHYLFRPDDEAMVEHFRHIADETGLPVIIYNVVPWSYLSPALLTRIMHEVPLVVGVKQSAGDLKLLADLMLMAPDKLNLQRRRCSDVPVLHARRRWIDRRHSCRCPARFGGLVECGARRRPPGGAAVASEAARAVERSHRR
jgi:4-hydroxy-tetrahydrodipicolinate synthase